MAEGLVRHLKHEQIEAFSAGVDPKEVDPRAVRAMREAGIDIFEQKSKSPEELEQSEFDYVITLCDYAQRSCPSFPAKTRVLHVGFDDPPKLAAVTLDEEKAMAHYRRVRDEIRTFVEQLPEALGDEEPAVDSGHQKQFQSGIKAFLEQMSGDLMNGNEE